MGAGQLAAGGTTERTWKQKLKRAQKLRAKSREGPLSPAERDELASLPPKQRAGRKPRSAVVDSQPESSPPPPPPGGSAAGEPPPEPPPRVEVLPASGDWRAKYRRRIGREGACVQCAVLYCALLKRLAAYIESQGGRPVLDAAAIDETVLPAAVLVVDHVMPAGIELGPEVEVAIGTGLLTVQAAMTARRAKPKPTSSATPPRPSRPVPPPDGTPPPPTEPPRGNGHNHPPPVIIDEATVF